MKDLLSELIKCADHFKFRGAVRRNHIEPKHEPTALMINLCIIAKSSTRSYSSSRSGSTGLFGFFSSLLLVLSFLMFDMTHDIVKLRSRSRSCEGQVRVRKVKETKDLDLSYTLFLVFTHPPTGNSFLALERSRQVRWT